jgi:hypothetical protein
VDSEHEAERVAAFVAKGNFHAAYNIVLSALNACRKEGDQAGVERFLTIIKGIIAEMESEFGSQ